MHNTVLTAGLGLNPSYDELQGGHSPGKPGKVREKSVKMCSCMWSITVNVLDTKYYCFGATK